jgi:hypothetical protein
MRLTAVLAGVLLLGIGAFDARAGASASFEIPVSVGGTAFGSPENSAFTYFLQPLAIDVPTRTYDFEVQVDLAGSASFTVPEFFVPWVQIQAVDPFVDGAGPDGQGLFMLVDTLPDYDKYVQRPDAYTESHDISYHQTYAFHFSDGLIGPQDIGGIGIAVASNMTSNSQVTGSVSIVAVPEPEIFALILAGLCALGAIERRRVRMASGPG